MELGRELELTVQLARIELFTSVDWRSGTVVCSCTQDWREAFRLKIPDIGLGACRKTRYLAFVRLLDEVCLLECFLGVSCMMPS
jgi:hypothetical protein